MRILKIILPLIALLVGAMQFALTNGLWNIGPEYISGLAAVAGLLGAAGVQPLPISDYLARLLGAGATLGAVVMGIHAAQVSRGLNPHPWVWATAGFCFTIMGALGKLNLPPKTLPPPAPPAPGPGAP